MCCLLACSSVIGPRIVFVLVWIFGTQVELAFDAEPFNGSFWWPLLGLIFAPWTALMYALMYSPTDGVSGFGIFMVGLGILADAGSYVSGFRTRDQAPWS
jgi:hypothetical protein